jgi:GR25 family glycosyltransferase involved in LPS biosynthesis
MRIGITADIQYSVFSAGHPNAAMAAMEAFQAGGHEVVFLHNGSTDNVWWDDVKALEPTCPRSTVEQAGKLDLVVEIGFFLTPIQRSSLNTRCVWYCRKPAIFTDIESTVYGSRLGGRNLEGVSAIWLADLYNTQEDIKYLNTLYPNVPVIMLPWLWSPTILEAHLKDTGGPVWPTLNQDFTKPWSLHITESNASNTSSCTLPLVILRHSHLKSPLPIAKLHVHNAEPYVDSKYFKGNILDHCSLKDLSANLVGRQRIVDWANEYNSVILSHNRFVPLKMANLEAVWMGIPLVHNNTTLKELGHGLEILFYSENSVSQASDALQVAITKTGTISYATNSDELSALRADILRRFSPEAKATQWLEALTSSLANEAVVVNMKPEGTVTPQYNLEKPREFNILFTDMWDQFNESYNTFILAMKNALPNVLVKGYSSNTLPPDVKPDLHIFGPYSQQWRSYPDGVAKVHFTAENTPPVEEAQLNIGFNRVDPNCASYFRMPLWMFEIDWFSANLAEIRNPLPVPIDACVKPPVKERTKFCAFIVTNPSNQVRNQMFHGLNAYKPVDSAGRLFNNVGDAIFAGLGGGGGELKKHEFLKDYKFCIVFENSSSEGYATEKLLHAKAAGCVPIYWGDPSITKDFDSAGFIDVTGCKTVEEMVQMVKEVDESPTMWEQMAKVPALSTEKVEGVRNTFSEMVKRFLQISGNEDLVSQVPANIGATYTPVKTPLLVTAATKSFTASLIDWLNTAKKHRTALPDLSVRVYIGHDISEHALRVMKERYTDLAEFVRFPKETPADFSDFWNPEHYAWKLWMYNHLASDPTLFGRLVFYTDCGTSLVRWPNEWLEHSRRNDLSLLETIHRNRYWCHNTFCSILQVTEEELDTMHIAAGITLFKSGSPRAIDFFNEAYKISCIRDAIVGEKWAGFDQNKDPYGHRHDQSIMSILACRHNIARYPFENVCCYDSARTTYYTGKSIYLHRGEYKSHDPLVTGIDDAFVINLDRRQDRRAAFLEYHPDLKGKVKRIAGIDGRTLRLTPLLARLFKPNEFFWKKGVMGCSLSHLKLWTMLVNEPEEIQTYLIMEDDARLKSGWQDSWKALYPNLPNDWDCVYLGGILPPNKEGFFSVLENVAPGVSRIAPNKIFGQTTPTRYFHFCAYSYVLSRRGAMKILDSITRRNGYWAVSDHMICNQVDTMNLYVVNPLLAGASQDDDPKYTNSEFNDFSRVDTFDSDLWNNNDRFSEEEVQQNLAKYARLDPIAAVDEAMAQKPLNGNNFLCLDSSKLHESNTYEHAWLNTLFPFSVKGVKMDDPLHMYETPILVLMKHWEQNIKWLETVRKTCKQFKILHMSDEFLDDPTFFYDWPEVTHVMRFYVRDELRGNPKVFFLPLGPHWIPSTPIPAVSHRQYTWSFLGTNWNGRSDSMELLKEIQPHNYILFKEWNDPRKIGEEEYIKEMLNTKFIPCPRGNNLETFRFYESLECGCIPVFVELPEVLCDMDLPFIQTNTWAEVVDLIRELEADKDALESYRTSIQLWWNAYKRYIKDSVSKCLV